jgi:hypothetical protein
MRASRFLLALAFALGCTAGTSAFAGAPTAQATGTKQQQIHTHREHHKVTPPQRHVKHRKKETPRPTPPKPPTPPQQGSQTKGISS